LAEIRFYLDENVPLEVGRQLALSGVDVVSARGLDRLGDADRDHLRLATEQGRVLCTHDQDFLRLAAEGADHQGIAFLPQTGAGIGTWVRGLRALHARIDSAATARRVFFLPLS
jgi:hypothetical protein